MSEVFYNRVGASVRLDSTRGRRRVRGSGVSYKRDKHLSETIVDAAIEASEECKGTSEVSSCELNSVSVTLCIMPSVQNVTESPPEAVEVGRHGVVVENGRKRGWMLPTVPVERDWSAPQLLDRTSCKAGLGESAWRKEDVSVYAFEGQIFREREPGGDIEEVELAVRA
jgi:uncharacterized protein (TIGR00296 family)